MPRIVFTWNPGGFRRFSFRNFKLFPNSPQSQLTALLLGMAAVIIGSLLRLVLPLNLNFLIYAVIGYYLADKIHPHPLAGPVAVTVGVIGLAWAVVMFVPDSFWFPPEFMLTLAANILLGQLIGTVLAAFTKAEAA